MADFDPEHFQVGSKVCAGLRIVPFGSSDNGLGSAESDVDISICIPATSENIQTILSSSRDVPTEDAEKFEDTDVRAILDTAMAIAEGAGFTREEVIKVSRVPVIKLREPENNTRIDLCINHPLPVMNTSLIKEYCAIDPRVRPLLLTVKHWCRMRGCSDSRHSLLSSYAWSLLVVRFLQTAVTPPVLPNIQTDPSYTSFVSKNRENVSALLMRFFAYYGTNSGILLEPQLKRFLMYTMLPVITT